MATKPSATDEEESGSKPTLDSETMSSSSVVKEDISDDPWDLVDEDDDVVKWEGRLLFLVITNITRCNCCVAAITAQTVAPCIRPIDD